MLYRQEIDGLRAIAVLPVIMFHAGFSWFSGGYVGVDVFFVISGYLITSILLNDLDKGTFSIVKFYERRARRILPALFFVIFVSIPFAWMWMTPNELKNFAQGFVAITFFASNILFWIKEDYFSAPAEENPLLHTWSLAVEEQFYIFFPLILLALWRFGRQPIFYFVLFLTAISFLLSEWGWRNYPAANFYLLPTRAWEIGVGSICAFILYKKQPKGNQLLSFFGLILIFYSILFYTEATPFPSIYTIVPVIGVALIIIYGTGETITAKILKVKIFVGIGLISFSAYLWHQPLFAFARLKSIQEPSEIIFLLLTLASLALAFFSWVVIENPFRNSKKISTKGIFSLSAAGSLFILSLGLIGHLYEGFDYRVNERIKKLTNQELKIYESLNLKPLKCINTEKKDGNPCQFTENNDGLSIAIIGDSHAARVRWPLEEIAKEFPITGYLVNQGGCPPLIGAYIINGNYEIGHCNSLHKKALEFVKNEKIDVVLLVARWSLYTTGDYQGRASRYLLSETPNNHSVSIKDSRDTFTKLMPITLKKYKDTGAKVIILHQVPQQSVNPIKLVERLMMTNENNFLTAYSSIISETSISKTKNLELQNFNKNFFSNFKNYNQLVFDSEFCNEKICAWGDVDGAFYTDSDHISMHGSLKMTKKLRKSLLDI